MHSFITLNQKLAELKTGSTGDPEALSRIENIVHEVLALLGVESQSGIGLQLLNLPRVQSEISKFVNAPGFARQPAAYILDHQSTLPLDLKLFWLHKTTKTNLSWVAGLTPNFEDNPEHYENRNIGIDFVIPEAADRVFIVLSSNLRLRVLEVHDQLTHTQREIFEKWIEIARDFAQAPEQNKQHLYDRLWKSFDYEPTNREFYKQLVERFDTLTQHLAAQGIHEENAKLFTVRLIGRLLFVWFVRKKGFIDESQDYFTVAPDADQATYYRMKLEPLFFKTLNTEIKQRATDDNTTPFLNGGLFEPVEIDFYGDKHITFPKNYFTSFFSMLDHYNFTVDEGTSEYAQVAIDPEMLGRVFENLLASQRTETGEQARKAKGAFYTPREIVDYMCAESLIAHLSTTLPDSPVRDERVRELVTMKESVFRDQDHNKRRDFERDLGKQRVIGALDNLRILDPAVGSGAFPVGMLQLLVRVYERLDPKLEKKPANLKRNILSRSLYGVDIDQMAIQICRLRAWLSILVDMEDAKKVEPLPNLDFKFVCANTLIPLADDFAPLGSQVGLREKLIEIREKYYEATRKQEKGKLRKRYLEYITDGGLLAGIESIRQRQLKEYNPFNPLASATFYDPDLMHGVPAFDIVIGNPPYISALVASKIIDKKTRDFYKDAYLSAKGTYDIYLLFFEKGLLHLKEKGVLVYITPTKYLSANYAQSFRKYIGLYKVKALIDFSQSRVFESAGVSTFVSIFSNQTQKEDVVTHVFDQTIKFSKPKIILNSRESLSFLPESLWGHLITGNFEILKKIYSEVTTLEQKFDINGSSTVGEADEYSKYISEKRGGKKIINTGTVFPYTSLWGKKEYSNKRTKILKPYLNTSDISDRRRKMYDTKKVIFPKLCKGLYATVDFNGEFASTNTTFIYNLDETSVRVVGALVNSTLYNFIYKSIFSGLNLLGSFQVQAPQIRLLPYKEPPQNSIVEIKRLIDNIFIKKELNPESNTQDFESQIDQLVYKLYGLTPEEIKIVEDKK